ncbi:MAG: FAD-binding protein, partial [Alistipes sp.]|nr:FAD-binding protein [Alistipes sp.]
MKVSENISLAGLNSFGVEGRAARLVEWDSAHELREVSFTERWLALGGGNNMLFAGDYDGTLIKSAAKNIDITGETNETLSVRAGAGVDWSDFTNWCIARGLWGVENLSGIPGTVGAAPIQNIGAYGAEVSCVIRSMECFAVETGTGLTLAAEHCGFGYRDSVFKRALRGRVIVTAVDFELSKVPRPNLKYAALAEKMSGVA